LNEEPEVKADILITIGDTYAAMGQFEKSERVLELALKLQREINAPGSLTVADALYLLANTKRGLGKKKEQIELYEQANAIYRNNADGESQFPYFLLDYAASFSSAGNHAEAVRLTKESLDILQRKKGETHTAVAIARENLAVAYERWGDIDNAFLEIQKAVKLMPQYSGTTPMRLGNIYFLKGDLEKAEEQFLKARADFEKDNNLVWTSNALASLSGVYKAKGDNKKALDFITQAIDLDRQVYAPDHRTFLVHLANRGVLLTQTGDHKEGETIIRQAIKTWNKNKQNFAVDPSFGEQFLGECLLIQKRFAEAEPLLLNRYRKLKETQHPASPHLKLSVEKLAELYDLWGKPEKAALYAVD
jgi:serine/threonine-protein kinase